MEAFDDKFQKKECVYGIVRDSTNKRITISFRGTDNNLALVSNWLSNISIAKKKVDLPEALKDVLKEDGLNLHTGFYSEYTYTKNEIGVYSSSLLYCYSHIITVAHNRLPFQ